MHEQQQQQRKCLIKSRIEALALRSSMTVNLFSVFQILYDKE